MLIVHAGKNSGIRFGFRRLLLCATVALVGFGAAHFARAEDLRNATLRPATPAAGSCCQGEQRVRTNVRPQPPAPAPGCSCCQANRTAHADEGNLRVARRSVAATNASASRGGNTAWRDRKAPHRIQFPADMAHEIRLVMFETDADSSQDEITRQFLKNARAYEKQNVSWSFDHPYTYTRTSVTRQLIAGWRDDTTGEFAYVALHPVDDQEAAGFVWADNLGELHSVDRPGWQATNWAVVRNPDDEGADFFIGIQMGRQAGNDEMHLVFRPQFLDE